MAITLNDTGCFLIPEFSATGGVSYRRTARTESIEGDRLTADFATRKEVDHVELLAQSRGIVSKAYAILEKHAAHTPLGYYVDVQSELTVREALAELSRLADAFNRRAQDAGSERRTRIAVYSVALLVDDERAAQRLTEIVRDRLSEMRAALVACDRKAFDGVRSQRLDRLATGIQADAIRMALECATQARRAIVELARDGLTAHEIAERLDLSGIDSALTLFEIG